MVFLYEGSNTSERYAVFVYSEVNDGGCVNDQQLRDFTNQFLHIPLQPVLQRGSCNAESDDDDCTMQKSHYGSPEELQNFTYTVINPAFAGTMRGLRVVQQLVPHHQSAVKVGYWLTFLQHFDDCSDPLCKNGTRTEDIPALHPSLQNYDNYGDQCPTCSLSVWLLFIRFPNDSRRPYIFLQWYLFPFFYF